MNSDLVRSSALYALGVAVCFAGCAPRPAAPADVEVSPPSPVETAERQFADPEVEFDFEDETLEFKFFADPRPDEDALPADEAARLTAEYGDDIRETVLREQLSYAKLEGTVFVSFGADDEGNPIDPSPEFFERLKDLPYNFRPASKARYPELGEMTEPNKFRGVEDPETGEPSWVYTCKIRRWFEGLEVEVEFEQYIGPLGAGGQTQVMRLDDGNWIQIESCGFWVS